MSRLPYFDRPDNEECFQKIWYNVKTLGVVGLITSWTDVLMVTHPKTNYDKLQRVVHWMVPFVAMGATTAAVTCSLANIRKKNDVWNYAIGGFAGGSIWGATYRSVPLGAGVGFVWAVFCMTAKIAHRDNWTAVQPFIMNQYYGSFRAYEHDLSIRKDPKDVPKREYGTEH